MNFALEHMGKDSYPAEIGVILVLIAGVAEACWGERFCKK
jgi:hypothetical protein